jgi:hypothetical protein
VSLPQLYAVPDDDEEWRSWAFNHAANHYDWIPAIYVLKASTVPAGSLTTFLLSPVDQNNIGIWLYNHQIAHNQANIALGTKGYDLLSFDWSDEDQFSEWLRFNGDEHVRISAILGLG